MIPFLSKYAVYSKRGLHGHRQRKEEFIIHNVFFPFSNYFYSFLNVAVEIQHPEASKGHSSHDGKQQLGEFGAGSTRFHGDVTYDTTGHYASVSCVIQSELLQRRRTSSAGSKVFALIWNDE